MDKVQTQSRSPDEENPSGTKNKKNIPKTDGSFQRTPIVYTPMSAMNQKKNSKIILYAARNIPTWDFSSLGEWAYVPDSVSRSTIF